MDAALMQTIIEGNPAITINVNAADLRNVVVEIVKQERQRIKDAIDASRELPTMTRRQAAEALNIHVNTLDRWAADGYVTPVKIGTKVLYKASDIDAILARNQEKNNIINNAIMKSVIITKMHLLNFKGVRELTIEFGKDFTNILGRNGSGKTTIFDAFTWVLFGKDSADRKQFDIKTLDKQGVAIPRIPHEVSITLQVDGQVITLTRRYTEKWTKKRGSAVEEFSGHEEERIYNEVPCSLKEWNEKITAICPEQVFKFITNPDYFTSQRWDAQRTMLFRMAGGVTDEDIANGNADFANLLSKLTGKTLEEYNREIGAKKKRIKAQIEEIPGRIDECNRTIAEHEADYPAIKQEAEEKKKHWRALMPNSQTSPRECRMQPQSVKR